jgi:hypothetical protein
LHINPKTMSNPSDEARTLRTRAVTLAKAVGKFIASGMEKTPPDEEAERWAVCQSCEHLVGRRCAKCGCKLTYKLMMKSESCPIGKW